MQISIITLTAIIAFLSAIVITGFARNLSKYFNVLIDIPDKSRKFHFRPTPLIGGISIHLGMLLGLMSLFLIGDIKFSSVNGDLETLKTNITVLEEKYSDFSVTLSPTKSSNYLNQDSSYSIEINGIDQVIDVVKNNNDTFGVSLDGLKYSDFSFIDNVVVNINDKSESALIDSSANSFFEFTWFALVLICVSLCFQCLMLLDDWFGLKHWIKFLIQMSASATIILLTDLYVSDLGLGLLGLNMDLGIWGIPFTILAVTGITNAFNMIDGIDGLCSGIALIGFTFLALIAGNQNVTYSLLIAIFALLGFMIYNLGLFGKKRRVFLGDHGSNFLGFIIAWTCISFASSDNVLMQPVTALWIVAIPLLDSLMVMAQRGRMGLEAFEADRTHIHFLLVDKLNFSQTSVLSILICCSLVLALIGYVMNVNGFTNNFSFVVFIIVSSLLIFGKNALQKL